MSPRSTWLGAGLPLVFVLGCDDPLRERGVDALGPEIATVPAGPLHRAGQPCLTCHDGRSSERAFSVAGTIFATAESGQAAPGVVVALVDAEGRTFRAATNCAGNFFVEPADFTPRYPLFVALESGAYRVEMETPVQRDGSCASCHVDPASNDRVGHVFVFGTPRPTAPNGCP